MKHKVASSQVDDIGEALALCESPLACAVADAWLYFREVHNSNHLDKPEYHRDALIQLPQAVKGSLDRLEAATRGSALRRVKP